MGSHAVVLFVCLLVGLVVVAVTWRSFWMLARLGKRRLIQFDVQPADFTSEIGLLVAICASSKRDTEGNAARNVASAFRKSWMAVSEANMLGQGHVELIEK